MTDRCAELWYNIKTGAYIEVYERNEVYVRFQTNNKSDMNLQGHEQWDYPAFSKKYKFIGEIVRKE